MPATFKAPKNPGFRFDGSGKSFQTESVDRYVVEGRKGPAVGHGWKHPSDPRHTPGFDFTRLAGKHAMDGTKVASMDGGRRTDPGKGARFTSRDCGDEGTKLGGSWFHGYRQGQGPRNHGSKSKKRKAASAMIAKIPRPLSEWIAKCYLPN